MASQALLGLQVDALACNGSALVAGCSSLASNRWTGSVALLRVVEEEEPGAGGRLEVLQVAAVRQGGVPACSILPLPDQFTKRSVAAVGTDTGAVELWEFSARPDKAQLQRTHSKVLHDSIVSALAAASASAGGNRLASGSWDGCLRLWDCEAALACSQTLGAHAGEVHAAQWAADGRTLVSAGQDGRVLRWDARAPAGAGPAAAAALGAPVLAVTHLPKQPHLLLAGDQLGQVAVLDERRSGDAPLKRMAVHRDAVRAIACAPDGTSATAGDDGRVLLFPGSTLAAGEVEVGRPAAGPAAAAGAPRYWRALAWAGDVLACGGSDQAVHLLQPRRPGLSRESSGVGREGSGLFREASGVSAREAGLSREPSGVPSGVPSREASEDSVC
eukprot:scaffold9.g3289.t1